jgi:hypothetical protein
MFAMVKLGLTAKSQSCQYFQLHYGNLILPLKAVSLRVWIRYDSIVEVGQAVRGGAFTQHLKLHPSETPPSSGRRLHPFITVDKQHEEATFGLIV